MYGLYLDLMAPLFALLLTFILVLAEQIYMTLRVRFRKMPIDNVGFPRALIFADKRAEDMTSSDLDEAVESGELDCTAFGLSIVGRYFGNVCELDLIFDFHRAYFVLDEVLVAGGLQETSKKHSTSLSFFLCVVSFSERYAS